MPANDKLDLAAIKNLVVAGWTGRNTAALEAHIKELEALGVKRPKSVPIFYRNAVSLLTTADTIQVMGDKSSGEVEFVLYSLDDGLWVGVGSDHTDRKAETINVTLSKQMCAKPVGPTLWRYDEVKPHWDKLTLRSFVPGERQAAALPGGAGDQHALARGADQALHRRRQARARHRDVLRHVRGARRDFVVRARSTWSWKTRCWGASSRTATRSCRCRMRGKVYPPSFRDAGEAREPGIHNHGWRSIGFRVRRLRGVPE